jgi:hypothetical protein
MSFPGWTTEQKQTALSNAYQAKVDITLGKQVTSISYSNDAGSRSMSYQVSGLASVERLIAELEIDLGVSSRKKRGPITLCN